jgi:hypothetical protein
MMAPGVAQGVSQRRLVLKDYLVKGAAFMALMPQEDVMAEGKEPAPQDGLPLDLEQECETWDWARAAGVSAQELRKALQGSSSGAQDSGTTSQIAS